MKVLLLGFTKIKYMPYIHFYLDKLNNCEIHLLYWARDDKPDIEVSKDIIVHKFYCYQEDSVPVYKKIKSFLKYRKTALKIIKEGRYDLLIVLYSTTGIVIQDILNKYYKNRYILDYRDVTYEHNRIYKRIVHQLVNNSIVTFVSSDAFKEYLPKTENIYTSHNLLLESLNYREVRRTKPRIHSPIRIRYWGLIRNKSINKLIIGKLANDNRFELHYHGREQDTAKKLKEYCSRIGAKNIYFHGEYKPKDRYIFASETDILHNIYENDRATQPAMSNKFYDGIIFYIPQLCNEGSFMAEQIDKYSIGLSCSPNLDSFADEIYRYFHSIKFSSFDKRCDYALSEIMKEYSTGDEVIKDCVNIIDN